MYVVRYRKIKHWQSKVLNLFLLPTLTSILQSKTLIHRFSSGCVAMAKSAKEAAMQRIKIIIRRNNCILFWKTILQQFKDNAAVYIYTADAF